MSTKGHEHDRETGTACSGSAPSGKGDELSAFPRSRPRLVQEAGTHLVRLQDQRTQHTGSSTPREPRRPRQAHLGGEIPTALGQVAADLLAKDPDIRTVDVTGRHSSAANQNVTDLPTSPPDWRSRTSLDPMTSFPHSAWRLWEETPSLYPRRRQLRRGAVLSGLLVPLLQRRAAPFNEFLDGLPTASTAVALGRRRGNYRRIGRQGRPQCSSRPQRQRPARPRAWRIFVDPFERCALPVRRGFEGSTAE